MKKPESGFSLSFFQLSLIQRPSAPVLGAGGGTAGLLRAGELLTSRPAAKG